jgi:hypothetical protein
VVRARVRAFDQARDHHGRQHRCGQAERDGREGCDGRHVQRRPAEQAGDPEVRAVPSKPRPVTLISNGFNLLGWNPPAGR